MGKIVTLGVRETAVRLGYSQKHVFNLIYERKLPATKNGRVWRIPIAAIEQRLKQREIAHE
jgi:excisionase family DNA binding protein